MFRALLAYNQAVKYLYITIVYVRFLQVEKLLEILRCRIIAGRIVQSKLEKPVHIL
jgi:hypothetical protein